MKVEIDHLHKTFRQNGEVLTALSDIHLEIQEGEFVCIVGPSGCGKSTLVNIIAGLDFPSTGSIRVAGNAISSPGSDRVVVFQEPALFPWLTVYENIEFGLKAHGVLLEERRKKVLELVKLVHLGRFINSYPHELSGGMKQRVALARALAMKPKVLLMDEPFGQLDAQTRSLLQQELQEISIETMQTTIFVTHNVREAVALADRIFIMTARPGRLKKEYRVEFARPRQEGDPALIPLQNKIMEALRDEIEKVVKEELDIDYVVTKRGVLRPVDRNLGSRI